MTWNERLNQSFLKNYERRIFPIFPLFILPLNSLFLTLHSKLLTFLMLSSRRSIERPPSKIAGGVYIIIGIFALFIAAFVWLYKGVFAGLNNVRIGFSAVIAAYGFFRIYTGISMIRRANAMSRSIPLDPVDGSGQEPKSPQL